MQFFVRIRNMNVKTDRSDNIISLNRVLATCNCHYLISLSLVLLRIQNNVTKMRFFYRVICPWNVTFNF